MTSHIQNATAKYASANLLQSGLEGYLLMFDALLRMNAQGREAYMRGDYEAEYLVQEKVVRILIGMHGMFDRGRTENEDMMFDFFSSLLDMANRFASFDDRKEYYLALRELIDLQHKNWKNAVGRE